MNILKFKSQLPEEKQPIENGQWIESIQNGDASVFETLFRTYYASLCGFVYQYTKSTEAAEEIVQNIFLKIWENHEKWKPHGTIKSYLYKAAKNHSLNYLKHQTRKQKIFDSEAVVEIQSDITPADELHGRELHKAVSYAVNKLPEKCRLIFNLNRQEGMTYTDIADNLDISIKTVETQMGRALKTLRRILAPFL
ncbi:RNA polymerase sigma-70 factor [candidate division KSB1 bacterium]|nr:RNA polymerase sigma-70 factor [candidate division KSB1 bacterium]MBL7092712.1 RNA polymerase sigma-70 factor [candidate division KSB1 bacterium]